MAILPGLLHPAFERSRRHAAVPGRSPLTLSLVDPQVLDSCRPSHVSPFRMFDNPYTFALPRRDDIGAKTSRRLAKERKTRPRRDPGVVLSNYPKI